MVLFQVWRHIMLLDTLNELLKEYKKSEDPSKIQELFMLALQSNLADQKREEEKSSMEETQALMATEILNKTIGAASFTSKDRQKTVLPHPSHATEDLEHYTFEKLLGHGGMGLIWRTKDTILQRRVALKMLHEKHQDSPERKEEFIEEAQISAQLQHPGIVPVYEMGQSNKGFPYFTMKEIEGRTLKEVITSLHKVSHDGIWRSTNDGWTLRRLITVFVGVVETISYAHSKGVIHRDLKPNNIMIGNYGEVWVVDWGIAKIVSSHSTNESNRVQTDRSLAGFQEENGYIIGTPAYMSPEQAWGNISDIDEMTDIYSLGAILYEILNNDILYKGSVEEIISSKRGRVSIVQFPVSHLEPEETINIVSAENKDTPCHFENNFDFLPHAPATLVKICNKALSYLPHKRHRSAQELIQDLQAWLEGAERKEKALAIIAKCHALETEIIENNTKANFLWNQANDLISKKGWSCEEGWKTWKEAQQCNTQIEEQQEEIQNLLQGAFIYDPELIDIHRKQVEFAFQEYLEAEQRVDFRAKEKILRRIRIHLEYLPREEVQYWNEKIESTRLSIRHKKHHGFCIGRKKQIQEAQEKLCGTKLLNIVGTAGVGKTHMALQLMDDWKRGQKRVSFFCDITQARDRLGIEQALATSLSMTLSSQEPIQQIIHILKNYTEVLLVIDNAEHIIEHLIHIVEDIISSVDSVKIMVTSRMKLGIVGEVNFVLSPMSSLEAFELFIQKAPPHSIVSSLSEENRSCIGEIVDKLDRLPLAIELAAARVSMMSLSDILERLAERFSLLRGRLRAPSQKALQGALDWSWSLLSDEAKLVLIQCSVFHGGFDLSAAESVIMISQSSVSPSIVDILEALCDDNLLYQENHSHGNIRYRSLLSIYEYARQKGIQDYGEAFHLAEARHASYYAKLYEEIQHKGAMSQRLAQDLDNFMYGVELGALEDAFLCCQAAIQFFCLQGPITRGIEISEKYLQRPGLYAEIKTPIQMTRITCLRIAGKIKQARMELNQILEPSNIPSSIDVKSEETVEAEDSDRSSMLPNDKSTMVQNTSITPEAWVEKGRLEESDGKYNAAQESYQQALEIYKQKHNVHGIGQTAHRIASILYSQGEYEKSLQQIEEIEECFQDELDSESKVDFFTAKGRIYSLTGKKEAALLCYQTAQFWGKDLGNKMQEFTLLENIGKMHLYLSQYPKCFEIFQQCLQIAEEIDSPKLRAESLSFIAHVFFMQGKNQEAESNYIEALRIAKEIGDRGAEGKFMGNLLLVQQYLKTPAECIEGYKIAISIVQEVGRKSEEATLLSQLGHVYHQVGEYKQAIELYEKSIDIKKSLGEQDWKTNVLGDLGSMYVAIGKYEEGIQKYEEALEASIQIKNKRGEAVFTGNIGNALQKIHKYEASLPYFRKAIAIVQEIKDQRNEAVFRGNVGVSLMNLHRMEEAEKELNESISLSEMINFSLAYGSFLGDLAELYAKTNRLEQAFEMVSRALEIIKNKKIEYGKVLMQKIRMYQIADNKEGIQTTNAELKQVIEELKLPSGAFLLIQFQNLQEEINNAK